MLYSLKWVLVHGYIREESNWTPSIEPSITKCIEYINNLNHGIDKLIIVGRNRCTNCEMDLTNIEWYLIDSFGYIAQGRMSNIAVNTILGIWVRLKDKKVINIYVNGRIKETKNESNID